MLLESVEFHKLKRYALDIFYSIWILLRRFLDIYNKEFISLGGFNDLIKMRDGWMVYNKNEIYIGKSIKEDGE